MKEVATYYSETSVDFQGILMHYTEPLGKGKERKGKGANHPF
jgi:hypothetical protein